MTVEEIIGEFMQKLDNQLKEHDDFISQWNNKDWHERYVLIDRLLHGMWRTYEDAEDLADELRETFPPYPFAEIRKIKKWLKSATHKIEDFIEDDYTQTDTDDYMKAYQVFLSKVCNDKRKCASWRSKEKQLAENERELLDMLNNSYSVLLDLMVSSHESIHNMDDTSILLAYHNRKTRYEQVYWTERKDKGSFLRSLEKIFVWGKPTKMQLENLYQKRFEEMEKTRIGKLFIENEEEDFILEIAKLKLEENELQLFFRKNKELEELKMMAENMTDEIRDSNVAEPVKKKAGKKMKYLFTDGNETKENVFVKNQERFRFMQYIKAHNLSSRCLSCNKKDVINDILTCFIMHWIERKYVEERPSGGAIFRFMTEDCGFKTDVTPESYANEMRERMKCKNYSIEKYKSVAECFKKQLSTHE